MKEMIKEFLLVLLVIVVVFGFFIVKVSNSLRNIDIFDYGSTIAVYENEDTGHSVIFEEIGVPFFFGPSTVKLTLKDENGKKIDEVRTEISNDGSTLYKGNATVIWNETGVDITLHGCEQEDKTYTIAY